MVGVIVIRDLSFETSTKTEEPMPIPMVSTIVFGRRTAWLLPQRCNVVFIWSKYIRGLYKFKKILSPNAESAPRAASPYRGWTLYEVAALAILQRFFAEIRAHGSDR